MATPNEKLAASLAQLRKLQQGGRRVFKSAELTRTHRERLCKNGFLREIMKGWLISSSPDAVSKMGASHRDAAPSDDTTPFYASFWEFCARYCTERFGDQWHLSPEQSLLLHAENTIIPQQVILCAPQGANNKVELLFGSSLYDLQQKRMPPPADLTEREGLRLFTPEAALIKVPETFYDRNPVAAQVVLNGMSDASGLLRRLLDGGHSKIAGRLVGALRRIGRSELAEDILHSMRAADYEVREKDPFAPRQPLGTAQRAAAPITGRLQALWESCRASVIEVFPQAPGLPEDETAYLRSIDSVYQSDAYHSLSIEGYRVTPELIERARSGDWDPDHDDADYQSRDALAARGYWQAFQLVVETVGQIITGQNPGALVRTAHRDWYRALFQPSVAAGLIAPSALAGYRDDAVFLRGSRHVPPRWEAVRDAMPALFDLLEREMEPAVRAVLGHWLFGYVHPYPDGNGRVARFVMNAMLASGGYPWTVIQVDDREAYLETLETASVELDIGPFARFVAERVRCMRS
jgi:hypothetical protein